MSEDPMKEEKTPEMDKVIKKIKRLASRASIDNFLGKIIDKALDLIRQAERLMEKFRGNIPSELEETHCRLLYTKSNIFENQGYLTQGFEVANELLTIAEKYNNKRGLSQGYRVLGGLYRQSNDLDKALEHYDRSIILKEELLNERGEIINLVGTLNSVIGAAIIKNDTERVRKYFTRMEELHELNPNEPFITQAWKLSKARLLSVNNRPRDWGDAEKLCEELIQEESTIIHYKFISIQLLCKMLFLELRVTNDTGIIDEIKALFPKMIELAQRYRSTAFLVDFYTIQGKLALLTFDVKTARRSFTQARRIAERHGYLLGAAKISRLQEELEQQLTTWEHLKQKNAPFSERMELARVNEHIDGQFRKKIGSIERTAEEEVTVYKDSKTCLVCKGSAGGFNIYVCPKCDSIYCKGCAEAVVEIENVCWTCESPIDEVRPSKPFEQEEEEISIEAKDGKKSVEKGVPKKVKGDEKGRKL